MCFCLNIQNRIEYAELEGDIWKPHPLTVMLPDLQPAVDFLTQVHVARPTATEVVSALLISEKTARANRQSYPFASLLGTWRLGFITGTHNSRKAAGGLLGAGRFIPPWVTIQITYAAGWPCETAAEAETNHRGTVANVVKFGPIKLVVSGPVCFWPQRNILAFDFTHLQLALADSTLYKGYVGNGQQRESTFFEQSLKQQAFFTYFLVSQDCIAARGKGGGLALWVKETTGL